MGAAAFEAVISCVEAATACRAAFSKRLINFFFNAFWVAALVATAKSSAARRSLSCSAWSFGFFAVPYEKKNKKFE